MKSSCPAFCVKLTTLPAYNFKLRSALTALTCVQILLPAGNNNTRGNKPCGTACYTECFNCDTRNQREIHIGSARTMCELTSLLSWEHALTPTGQSSSRSPNIPSVSWDLRRRICELATLNASRKASKTCRKVLTCTNQDAAYLTASPDIDHFISGHIIKHTIMKSLHNSYIVLLIK